MQNDCNNNYINQTEDLIREVTTEGVLLINNVTKLYSENQLNCHCILPTCNSTFIVESCGSDNVSYRPMSELPILSNLYKKLFLARLKLKIDESSIIPNHQFGFGIFTWNKYH